MKPYYEDETATIYHGDCRDVIPRIDAIALHLVTDPPYGIGEARRRNASRSKLAVSVDYGDSSWDDVPAEEAIGVARDHTESQIIFGGNYYNLPPSSCWLVWDKENGANDFADAELAWTNIDRAVRIRRHRWHGMIRKNGETRWHPTQKPIEIMQWAISLLPGSGEILDPFMGSGTTLVAARNLGRRAIGIEREERYCEIAVDRLRQQTLF